MLSVTFAAFFISLGKILWVSDDHSPKTWAFYACHLQCILQSPWICSFLNVQTKITAFRVLSHCLHVKQSNQTFPSPFSLPPHLHVLLQTNGHELGWQLRRSGKVFGMLYHKQNLIFHCKRKFLKLNFLIKFIFNDQTLSNIMYTCTQQEFLLGKKNPTLWKESRSK